MSNYISLPFNYDSDSILRILKPLKITHVMSCDSNVKLEIYKLLGLKFSIATMLYFQLEPLSNSIIHMDKNLSNPKAFNTDFALNIPLHNGTNVLMRWYEDNTPDCMHEVFTGVSGTTTPLLPTNRAVCIDKLYYTVPHIVKINDWHSVENQSNDEYSRFISLRFYVPLEKILNYFLVRGTGIKPD